MPIFAWEAVTKEGVKRTGELDAPSRQSVLQTLERQQLFPVRVQVRGATAPRPLFRLRGHSISAVEKTLLCQHLAVMIRAGISMNPALEMLIADAENPALRQFLKDAQDAIRRGQPLWSAFAAYGSAFPSYFVGLVRAGESSGQLAAAFDQAATQLTREFQSQRKAIAALLYPAILMSVSTLLILFLLLFAIPRIAETITSLEVELPLFSRIVFGTSAVVTAQPIATFLFVLFFFAAAAFSALSRPGRALAAQAFWRFPISRSFLKKFAIARFARTLGALLKAGLPAVEALEITAGSVGVDAVRLSVLDARERIRRGSSFTGAFKGHSEYFPNLLTGMMAVGEQSGQLPDLLLTVSRFFEEDADRALQTMVALIEPLMLLVMGTMVGAIALSVILPIYQLVSAIQ
ncbi:MAG: type II secretion system F family protein [Candidatus Terrybacteria bacterium]|nr:type II secretion system F family protein [Candidatus Terrybacteria bacterium]